MNVGDVFRPNWSRHWWVIITPPSRWGRRVIAVNFTSNKHWQDQSCVLEPGEHPCIRVESVVYFAEAKEFLDERLDADLGSGQLNLHDEPASEVLIRRIRRCALESDFLPMKFVEEIEQAIASADDLS